MKRDKYELQDQLDAALNSLRALREAHQIAQRDVMIMHSAGGSGSHCENELRIALTEIRHLKASLARLYETNDANIRLAQENAELKARLKALGESV
jgi:uncharacterized protein YigA (DUF484 family)